MFGHLPVYTKNGTEFIYIIMNMVTMYITNMRDNLHIKYSKNYQSKGLMMKNNLTDDFKLYNTYMVSPKLLI